MKFFSHKFALVAISCSLAFTPCYSQSTEEEAIDLTVTEGDDASLKDDPDSTESPEYKEAEGEGRLEVDENLLKKLSTSDAANETYAVTRTNARTMTLLIPPPRGLIVDRMGEPLAQNTVAYQIVLKFGQFEDESDEAILAYGKQCLQEAQKLTGSLWGNISKEESQNKLLLEHYKYRRWLPLPLTKVLSEAEKKKLPAELPKGLELLPIYKRAYPNNNTACHIIGYTGSKGQLPKGPINHMDPLWEVSEGRLGFEKAYEKQLQGRPGVWRLMFDEQGNKILDELAIKPKPGGTVVTTLNLKWQKEAEKILHKKTRRGAFVVIDIPTGEILVLASKPTFDLNRFIPKISQAEYSALQKDPTKPLVSVAFREQYPPASTFKAVVAMGALESGLIRDRTTIYCPASVKVGNYEFKNWSKVPEGDINVYRALARSTNPFFYKLAQMKGSPSFFLSMARRLGMGERVDIPGLDDIPGVIPDEVWLHNQGRSRYYPGDPLNYSIGQGTVEATPLQVAQMMAGIGDGRALPKLHLIKQIQDMDGNVVYASHRQDRNSLASASYAASVVKKGLYDVVYSGTGGRARLSYTSICGKTGTGQYAKNRYVGWFAGFLPYDNPRIAFAAFYEGAKNESRVGGSSHAAPIVKDFFENMKKDVKEMIAPPENVVVVQESNNTTPIVPRANNNNAEDDTPVLVPIEEATPDTPPVLPEIIDLDDSSEDGNNAVEIIE